MLFAWVAVFLMTIMLLLPATTAHAATIGSHSVGLVLSKTCLTMIHANITSTCPTYEDLIELDNSDQNWSGSFIYDERGNLYRSNPNLENSWRLYDHDNEWRVFVDPPQGMHDRIKIITLQPNFDTYFHRSDAQVENYTRVVYHDRYVDTKCWQSTVNADKWTELVADTIFFMREDCDPEKTSYVTKELIPIELMEHDISTSQKWIDEKRLEYIKEFCIFKFRAC